MRGEILRIGLKGIPIFSIHIDSDRTMGRGAAAHSKYMANEYKAIMLGAPQAKANNISAYARVMKCDWWPLIVVLQFLKKLKVKQLTLQHNSKSRKKVNTPAAFCSKKTS